MHTVYYRCVHSPTGKPVALCLRSHRQGIRQLAAHKLGVLTSPFAFAQNKQEYLTHAKEIGLPFVIKPVMGSSGKGQSIVRHEQNVEKAWAYAQSGSRGHAKTVIIEGFIQFDYEVTLLTVRHKERAYFCDPIGHIQKEGIINYRGNHRRWKKMC